MLTDADHVYHAKYFKHPDDRIRYLKSQMPNMDVEHLLRKFDHFPKIYRDDLAVFAVIVNGKVVDTVKTRQEARQLAELQEGYVLVVDVPISERNHPRYDKYHQEIIKTPLVPRPSYDEKPNTDADKIEIETSSITTDVIHDDSVSAVVGYATTTSTTNPDQHTDNTSATTSADQTDDTATTTSDQNDTDTTSATTSADQTADTATTTSDQNDTDTTSATTSADQTTGDTATTTSDHQNENDEESLLSEN